MILWLLHRPRFIRIANNRVPIKNKRIMRRRKGEIYMILEESSFKLFFNINYADDIGYHWEYFTVTTVQKGIGDARQWCSWIHQDICRRCCQGCLKCWYPYLSTSWIQQPMATYSRTLAESDYRGNGWISVSKLTHQNLVQWLSMPGIENKRSLQVLYS